MSHSSKDQDIVNSFVNDFLSADLLSTRTKTINTSADDPASTARLAAGKSIWTQIRERLLHTGCFIACLSDSYFKSNWCIAELAVFHEMVVKNKSSNLLCIALLIDPDSKTWEANPFTQPVKLLQLSVATDLMEFVSYLLMHHFLRAAPADPTYTQFVSTKLNPLLNKREQRDKGSLVDLAQSHFSNPHISNGPITCLVQRAEYEQISVNMAERAKSKLLWTLFKSPLLVADAYSKPERLMTYDERFSEFKVRRKVRLVIFERPSMAKAYALTDVDWHKRHFRRINIKTVPLSFELLKERKERFETSAESNGGALYFTVLDRLPLCFSDNRKRTFTKKSFLEFAYSDYPGSQRAPLLLESGFTSEFSLVHRRGRHEKAALLVRHVTFYSPPTGGEYSDAIQRRPYKPLFGHLDDLRVIAESLLNPQQPYTNVFVTAAKIGELYGSTL